MIKLVNGWTLRERQEECHDKLISAYEKGSDRWESVKKPISSDEADE